MKIDINFNLAASLLIDCYCSLHDKQNVVNMCMGNQKYADQIWNNCYELMVAIESELDGSTIASIENEANEVCGVNITVIREIRKKQEIFFNKKF